MARRIGYDANKVKQSLTDLFWQKGFAETSLADLESASGLNRRQLYNGIGDKHAMFLQSLDDFTDIAGRQFLAALESEEASLVDIEYLLRLFASAAALDPPPRGCMVCTASQEEIATDPAVSQRINGYFERIRAAYENALTRSRDRGEIDLDDQALARRCDGLFATHVALCVLGRAGRPGEQLTRMVDQALNDLYA